MGCCGKSSKPIVTDNYTRSASLTSPSSMDANVTSNSSSCSKNTAATTTLNYESDNTATNTSELKDQFSSFTIEEALEKSRKTEVKKIMWTQLHDMEYLTSGGSALIYTAMYKNESVIIKLISPEFTNDVVYMEEIEHELGILSAIDHPNVVKVYGAGYNKDKRFIVLERLQGGTLLESFDKQNTDNKGKFSWKGRKDTWSTIENGVRHGREIADALQYCHDSTIPDCMVLHRDLKPGNIGFTLDGTVKIFDFGLAKILINASSFSDQVYEMSSETGSPRYMAPEVATKRPYNHKVDVYSFGIILWELLSGKKSLTGLSQEEFDKEVVNGTRRPPINKNWPKKLIDLMNSCWSVEITERPTFLTIVTILDSIIFENLGTKAGITRSSSFRSSANSLPARLDIRQSFSEDNMRASVNL